MTQEDKELLLKDLCGRLPYHVRVKVWLKDGTTEEGFYDFEHNYEDVMKDFFFYNKLNDLKPYLRPMSSMTEEEKEELSHLLSKDWSVEIDKLNNFYFDMSPSIFMEIDVFLNIVDWLNARHFDYHGLIEKGLAIEVMKENNPYKE